MEISIIILSYNTKKLTRACINSVLKFSKSVQFEIIVVDNGSTDGSLEWLVRESNIKLIENKENLGFSKGNNLGIKAAKGKYILLLNSDTELVEDSLLKMTRWMDIHPSAAVATCMLKNPNGSTQATGGFFPTLPRILLWSTFLDDLPLVNKLGIYHPHVDSIFGNYYEREHKLDWVTGAFFLMRREIIEKIGVLDEDFFMYVEELEYCYRIKKAGWEVFYTPITKIIHIGGASGIRENATLGEFNNLRLFYSKHKSFFEQVLLILLLKVAAFLRIIVFGLILGRKEAVKIYAKALV
ncbi:MAG: Glycosyl transferase family 2 [Microgenomates group bacterium Gr01-1014_5]|nr:MAG: Glycosyl transferase family 2 [Microgenomates group bacterium Gr01-1014_5]